jgi:hypothetical protein
MSKPQPTEAEFEELKRQRDEKFQAWFDGFCKEQGWEPKDVHVHRSHGSGCYCNCPEGPCQHKWDGPWWTSGDGCTGSATCSKCGELAFNHDMRCAP